MQLCEFFFPLHQYEKKGKHSLKQRCKNHRSKSYSGIEGAISKCRWEYSGKREQKNKQAKDNIFRKLTNVNIDELFKLFYLTIICSVGINTLQIVDEKA